MKLLIVLALAVLAVARPDEGTYDDRYDNFNVDEVIDNQRLLKSYAHCFLSQGKCTPDGNNFKKWIPDAVQTKCGKCSAKQKVLVAKVIKAMQAKLPEEWDKLLKIHDPKNKHHEELKAFVDQHSS